MTTTAQDRINPAASLFNLPNKLTSVRLVLSFVLFGTLWLHWWQVSLIVFAVAAITDWLDGYYARKRGLTSSLGRVYDPLVDKVMVSGVFIFLMEARGTALPGDAGLNAFMVTIIVAREFIVTGLRGFLEQMGVSFGADRLGKIKMCLQCLAILWILISLAVAAGGYPHPVLHVVRDVLNWSAVIATFISGANYVYRAVEHLA